MNKYCLKTNTWLDWVTRYCQGFRKTLGKKEGFKHKLGFLLVHVKFTNGCHRNLPGTLNPKSYSNTWSVPCLFTKVFQTLQSKSVIWLFSEVCYLHCGVDINSPAIHYVHSAMQTRICWLRFNKQTHLYHLSHLHFVQCYLLLSLWCNKDSAKVFVLLNS